MPDELYSTDELDAAVAEALREAEAKHKTELERVEAATRERLAGELAAGELAAGESLPKSVTIDHAELTSKVINRTNMVERAVLESAKRFQGQYKTPMPAEYIEELRSNLSSATVDDDVLTMMIAPSDDAQKERSEGIFDSIIGTSHAKGMREGKLKLPSSDPNLPYAPSIGGGNFEDDDLAKAKKLAQDLGRNPENLTMRELREYAQMGKDSGLI